MPFSTSFWDEIFGDRMSLDLPQPDGSTRQVRVTRKWFNKMLAEGKIAKNGPTSPDKPDPCDQSQSDSLAALIVQVAAHESGGLVELWKSQLDSRMQVALFEEYVAVLVAVTDRVVYQRCGDPARRAMMESLISTIASRFLAQVGATPYTRTYLAEGFEQRLFGTGGPYATYAACTSIMGDPIQTSIPFAAAHRLLDRFATAQSADSEPFVGTFKALTTALTALLVAEPYKALIKHS